MRTERLDGPGPAPPSSGGALLAEGGEYVEVLRRTLKGELAAHVAFFADARRLAVLAELLHRHFPAAPASVLNVGSGCFAAEFFLRELQRHRVVSIDREPRFAAQYAALRARGHLRNTEFRVADALEAEFPADSFDLVILHDLLYEPQLSFETLFRKYDRYLRPGGLLYFTVQDIRTAWLSRDKAHRRYALPALRAVLGGAGYALLACQPCSLDAAGWARRALKKLLWHGFGLATHYAMLARKTPSPPE